MRSRHIEAQVPDEPGIVIGGHSFGGRVASLAVAGRRVPGAVAREHPYAGLVCLSYPLHPPGKPENAAARIAHWPAIDVPALLLSGTSDPFARIELLEAAMPRSAAARSSRTRTSGTASSQWRADALDRIAAFVATLERA